MTEPPFDGASSGNGPKTGPGQRLRPTAASENPLLVDLFVEDRAQEDLIGAFVERIAGEEQRGVRIRVRSARGGHPRALSELDLFQRTRHLSTAGARTDLLVVAVDANCSAFAAAREAVRGHIDESLEDRTVIACPDPHVELWYLADPDSFHEVVGARPVVGKRKCERDRYKSILRKTVRDAGQPGTMNGVEFAEELAQAMDLYRAGKNVKSLKHFLDELRARLRAL